MKRLLLTLLLLLPGLASAAPVQITGKSVTLSWDPVTTYTNGSAIPSTVQVVYKAYYGSSSRSYTLGTRLVGATTSTSITFADFGLKFFAVKAVINQGTAQELSSEYSEEASAQLNPPLVPTAPKTVNVR